MIKNILFLFALLLLMTQRIQASYSNLHSNSLAEIEGFTATRVSTIFNSVTNLILAFTCTSPGVPVTFALGVVPAGGFAGIKSTEGSGEPEDLEEIGKTIGAKNADVKIEKQDDSTLLLTFTCLSGNVIVIEGYENHGNVCPAKFTFWTETSSSDFQVQTLTDNSEANTDVSVAEASWLEIKFTPIPYLPALGKLIIENVRLDIEGTTCNEGEDFSYQNDDTSSLAFTCEYDPDKKTVTFISTLDDDYEKEIDMRIKKVYYPNSMAKDTYTVKVGGQGSLIITCESGLDVDNVLATYAGTFAPAFPAMVNFKGFGIFLGSSEDCGTYDLKITIAPELTIEAGNYIVISFTGVDASSSSCDSFSSSTTTANSCSGPIKKEYKPGEELELLIKEVNIDPVTPTFTVTLLAYLAESALPGAEQQGIELTISDLGVFTESGAVKLTSSDPVVGELAEYELSIKSYCKFSSEVTYTIEMPSIFDLTNLSCGEITGCVVDSEKLVITRAQLPDEDEKLSFSLVTPSSLGSLRDPFVITIKSKAGIVLMAFNKQLTKDFDVKPGSITDLAIIKGSNLPGAITSYTWDFTLKNKIPEGGAIILFFNVKLGFADDYVAKMRLDEGAYSEEIVELIGNFMLFTIISAINAGQHVYIQMDKVKNPEEVGDFTDFYVLTYDDFYTLDKSNEITLSVGINMDCKYTYSFDYKALRLTCSLFPLAAGDPYGSDSTLTLTMPDGFVCDRLVESGPNLSVDPDGIFKFAVTGRAEDSLEFTYNCKEPSTKVEEDIGFTFTEGSDETSGISHVSCEPAESNDKARLTLECDNNKPKIKTKCKLTINRGSNPVAIKVIQINAEGLNVKPETARRLLEETVCDIKPDSMPEGTSCSYGDEGKTLTSTFDSPSTDETISFSNLEFVNPNAGTKDDQKISVRTFATERMDGLVDVLDDELVLDIECNFPCHTCSGTNTDSCNTCVNDEESGTYYSLHEVSQGDMQCLEVDKEDECNNGYFTSGDTCKLCEDPCLECKNQATYCTSCRNDKFAYEGNCEEDCPEDTIKNEDTKSCVKCVEHCDKCENESTCEKCGGDYKLYKGNCIASCDGNTFIQGSECFDCSEDCKTCSESATSCTSCKENLFLSKGTCITECPDNSLTEGQLCIECNEPCSKCETTADHCTDCIEGFFLYDFTCRKQCPAGTSVRTFGTDRTCTPCGDHCEACEWHSEGHEFPTVCTKCEKWYKRKESTSSDGDFAVICEKDKKLPVLLIIGWSIFVVLAILGLVLNYKEIAATCVVSLSIVVVICYIYQLIYSSNKEVISIAVTAGILVGFHYLLNAVVTAYVYYYVCKADKETSKTILLITSIISTLTSFQFYRVLFAWNKWHSAKVKELRYVLNLFSIGHVLSAVVIIIADAVKLSDLPWNTGLSMILFETILFVGCYMVALAIEVAFCNSKRATNYKL